MLIRIKTTIRNSMAQQIANAADAGSGPAKLKFFTGTMPAADVAITTQTLLGTLTGSDPVASIDNGTMTFAAITQDNAADNGGTAAFCQLTDSDDNHVCYLDVTNEAGNGAVKLNTVTVVAGGPIRMNSLTITIGGA